MKKIVFSAVLLLSAIAFWSFMMAPVKIEPSLRGAWKADNGIMICSDTYMSIAYFDVEKKKFYGTLGASYTMDGSSITVNVEYDYPNKTYFGQSETAPYELVGNKFTYQGSQVTMKFEKIGDAGNVPLSALWQIVGREAKDGSMGEIKKGARKTIKLLTDNRFQWAAINTETGEFFGTGGGTYTLKDGKYTENIEFFSRDSTRVGATLSFDAAVEGKKWQHMGKSSKGDKVNEVWEKQD
jgi:hypothetical protein